MKVLLLLVLALGLSGCASRPPEKKEVVSWRSEELVDHVLTRVQATSTETYWFRSEQTALATLGDAGGASAKPTVSWKIEDGELVIFDDDGVLERLAIVEKLGDRVWARSRWGLMAWWTLNPHEAQQPQTLGVVAE